jgi:hypothetical protein
MNRRLVVFWVIVAVVVALALIVAHWVFSLFGPF